MYESCYLFEFQILEQIEVKYVPEKADLDDYLLVDFKEVFEKFKFIEPEGDEVIAVTSLL